VRAARITAIAVALVICAGFVVGIRQNEGVAALTNLLSATSRLTHGQQRTAASELSEAKFAYPGQEVNLLAVGVAFHEGRYAKARSIALAATRAEPDNLQAWSSLAATELAASDTRALFHARDEMARLDPLDVHR
jgi:predicted Zn-dependent protease